MIRTINIKENNPNADYAIFLIDEEIKYSRAIGNRVVIIIHGYGSHGKGGTIKEYVKSYLPDLKKKGIITDYVFGENWGELNASRKRICEIAPEIILKENLSRLNAGVSVILI